MLSRVKRLDQERQTIPGTNNKRILRNGRKFTPRGSRYWCLVVSAAINRCTGKDEHSRYVEFWRRAIAQIKCFDKALYYFIN